MADSDMAETNLENAVKLQARQYQLEILERAKTQNTIAYLETGVGKTLISVLLIKAKSAELRKELPNRKCTMFLVPSVNLVYQQSHVLRTHTNLEVGHYCGDMDVDNWVIEKWKVELERNQVFVMTAQIFLDNLRHSFMQMERVNLIVFDECHRAHGRHAYSQIMEGFYHTLERDKRPLIFGMTASPLSSAGAPSRERCAKQMQELEKTLDSSIYTVMDRTELDKFVAKPVESFVFYEAGELKELGREWKENIVRLLNEVQEYCEKNGSSSEGFPGMQSNNSDEHCKDMAADEEEMCHKFMVARDKAKAAKAAAKAGWTVRSLLYVLEELGCWCAAKAAASTLEKCKEEDDSTLAGSESDEEDPQTRGYAADIRRSYIWRATKDLELDNGDPEVDGEPDEVLNRLYDEGWITSKVKALMEKLLSYREYGKDFRCIVFVHRIIAAEALCLLVKALPFLSFLPCAAVTGHKGNVKYLTSQKQNDIIETFRNGTIQLLFATDVIEEGLDVQKCRSVIRFDLSTTVRSHIQSRGRARQQASDYVMMVESGNDEDARRVEAVRTSEDFMRMEAIEQTQLETEVEVDNEPVEFYRVERTGAVVDDYHAVQLLHIFCAKLPNDRYSLTVPWFQIEHRDDSKVVCKVYLPSNAPESVRLVEGPPCSNKKKARERACLQACRLLHQCGALNDNLVPEKPDDVVLDGMDMKNIPFPKTGKWFQESIPLCLQGDWITGNEQGEDDPNGGVWLFAYGLCFEDKGLKGVDVPEREATREYAEPRSYILLMEKQMDVDTSQMKVPLFFAHNVYSAAALSPMGRVFIPWAKLRTGKLFHSWLFSRVLMREWSEGDLSVWSSSRAYLILPMADADRFSSAENVMGMIDWKVVETTMNEVEGCLPDGQSGQGRRRKRGQGDEAPPVLDEDTLMTLSGPYDVSAVRDKIITFNGQQFYVLSVRKDINADSPFGERNGKNRVSKAKTYTEYFAKKYGKVLLYRTQPMLEARPFVLAINLLHRRNNALGKEQDSSEMGVEEDSEERTAPEARQVFSVVLPPELCRVHVEFTPPFLRGALRLPSVIRRMECMLRAAELKAKVGVPISTSKVLEAITSSKGHEGYSYEQHEFLGDGFLKLMVSVHLYAKHPADHEGILTNLRKRMVSNSNLCGRAVERGIGNIVVAHQFDPGELAVSGVALPVATAQHQASGSDDRNGADDSVNGHASSESSLNSNDNNAENTSDDEDVTSDKEVCECVMPDGTIGRRLYSKTLADVVEALAGVYYTEVGSEGALKLLSWFGIHLDGSHKILQHTGSIPGEVIANDVDQVMEDVTKCANGPPEAVSAVPGEHVRLQIGDMDPVESSAGNMRKVEEIVCYRFKHPKLLLQAFMHTSYADVVAWPCYQRLEFLGDALIDWITTVRILTKNTDLEPGQLSVMRAMAVCNETLARVAVRFSLQQHLRHASSDLMNHITSFAEAVRKEEKKTPARTLGKGNLKAYGLITEFAPKVLGDIVESLIGAIFVDSEFDLRPVEKVCKEFLPEVTPETVGLHPVTQFFELCQAHAKHGELVSEPLPGGRCKVKVLVDGENLGEVDNSQKKLARKLAAALGYQALLSRLESAHGETENGVADDGMSAGEGGTSIEGAGCPDKRVIYKKQKKKDKLGTIADPNAADSSPEAKNREMRCESQPASGSGNTPSQRVSMEAEAPSSVPGSSVQSQGTVARLTLEGTAQGLSIVNPDGSLSTIVPAADVPTGGAVAGAAGQNYMPLAFFPMQPGAYSQYPAYPPLVGPGTSPPIPFPFLLCPVLSPQGAAYVTVPYTVAPSDGPASPVVTGPSPISPAARNNPDMEALLQTLRRGHSQPQTPSHPESPSQSQMARRKVGSPAARSQRGELTPRGNMSGNNSRGTPQASPWPSTSTERVHVSDSSPTTTASEGAWTGDRSDGEEISRAPIVHLPQKAKGSASAVTPREHQIRHDTGDGRSGHEVCLHTAERSRPQSVLPAGQESSPDSVAGVVPVEPGRLTTLSDSESAISTAESLKETSAEEASTATNRDDDQQPTQTRPAASPDKEVVSKIVNVLRIKANKASCSGVRSTSGTAGELASQGRHRAELNELCSQQGWSLDYCVVGEAGPGHMKRFTIKAMVNMGSCIHECTGDSLPTHKKAKESAAFRLMTKLRETGFIL